MSSEKSSAFLTHDDVRGDVDAFLLSHYKYKIGRAKKLSPDYGRLWQAILDYHQAGGKRIRPYILLLSYQVFGGKNYQNMIPVAAAVEMLHTCLLVHDDIIDRDYVRHGSPNIAGAYLRHYNTGSVDEHSKTHLSNSAALLAGDLLLSDTYQIILASDLDPAQKTTAMQLLGNTIFTVAGGQLLDTESVLLPFEAADPLTVAHLKTADYSFVSPMVLGATLAGARPDGLRVLRNFGEALGVAFQLRDDWLGVFGSAQKLGKPITSDLEENKRTYLMREAYALADAIQRKQLDELFEVQKPNDKDLIKLQRLLEETGAKQATVQAIREYTGRAREVLAGMQLDESSNIRFEQLIAMATNRKN